MATGIEEIDTGIASELKKSGIDVAGECYYREALLSLAQQKRSDVIVVSPHLPGEKDFLELVKDLRMAGFRLILLPGCRDDDEAVTLARRAAALGVYDILWDPVSPESVVQRILKPATLAEAGVEPLGDAPVNVGSQVRESVYVVFGDSTEKVSRYLEDKGYKVVGKDRSLDAAAFMAQNLDVLPDVYLVLGTASVCGVVDVGIDYGEALIDCLKRLRSAAPESRIVLILPESVEPEVFQNVLYMGIPDVYKMDSISLNRIPEMLSTRKKIDDFGLSTLPVPAGEPKTRRDGTKKKSNVLRGLTASVRSLLEKTLSKREKIKVSHPIWRARHRQETVAFSKGNTEEFQYELSPVEDSKGAEAKTGPLSRDAPERAHVNVEAPEESPEDAGMGSGQALDSVEKANIPLDESITQREGQFTRSSASVSMVARDGKVVVLGSPWIDGGTPAFLSLLKNYLSERGKTVVLDCGLLERKIVPVESVGARWVLIDAGDDPDSRAFKICAERADVVLWVVREPFLAQIGPKWRNRPKVRCREVAVLFGHGDPSEVEDALVIPCFQVKSFDDRKGLDCLAEVLDSSSRGARVLLVGFSEVPEVPGVICDSFESPEEAVKWAEFNPPDVAILREDLGKLSLIEYDFLRYNIPVVKTDSNRLSDALKGLR